MGISSLLACGGFVAAFFFGCCLAQGGIRSVSSWVRSLRLQVRAGSDAGLIRRSLQRGVPQIRSVTQLFMGKELVRAKVTDICWLLESRGYVVSADAVADCVLVAAVSVALVFSVLSGEVVVGLLLAAGCVAAVCMLADSRRKQTAARMREAVPDALHAMSACFKSGLSLQQTFQHLAKEMEGPLQPCFERAAGAMEAGESPKSALRVLRKEADVEEVMFVSVALEVQYQAGGSMQGVLDAARDSVATELKLMRQLQVQTSQARFSAQVVTVMPFLLIGAISLVSPGFLSPFFTSFAGVMVLAVALAMQVAGVVLARRMLQVRE